MIEPTAQGYHSKLPRLPPGFDQPSYYIGDLGNDISDDADDDADAMHLDEAEAAGPSLNKRQPRIRSTDDISIEGDTLQHSYEVAESDDGLLEKGPHRRWFIGYPGKDGRAKGVTGDEDLAGSIENLEKSPDGHGQWHILRMGDVDDGSVQRLNAKYRIGNELESSTTPELQEAFNLWQNPMTAVLADHPDGAGYVEGIQNRQPPFYEQNLRYLERTFGAPWKVTRVFEPVNTLTAQHAQRKEYAYAKDGGPVWKDFGLYSIQITKKLERQLKRHEGNPGERPWDMLTDLVSGRTHSQHQQTAPSEARERAETSPMQTGSEVSSPAQSEGGWIIKVSVDGDIIGVTEDQNVVTELLGFLDSDMGRSRWSIQNVAYDLEGEVLRKEYGVGQGDRTSKAVLDAIALWRRPGLALKCFFPNRMLGHEKDENAYDPSEPFVSADLRKNLRDWEDKHEKIDMQRYQEFTDRFGQITLENLTLWRQGKSALDATREYPIYSIVYSDNGSGPMKEGTTDDPFMRDKVRYIRKHWDQRWKISQTLVEDREQALQRMFNVDGGKWQATLPYYCTENLWRSIEDIEMYKLGQDKRITRDMIKSLGDDDSGDEGDREDDDSGDSDDDEEDDDGEDGDGSEDGDQDVAMGGVTQFP
ncbi:uncharacterized protein N0V89_004618 [Didymosphaeria variabile]|uniref:Uncharacterized protein n=1 Tax=Didymosphaeria variabile TaxID=1932322 RepID=A0A9W8XSI2_9PLEO|nr:uncharacterized protein N0V89_004618 [Didymosphaeria variabile]KAJ4356583.1 hypothetical protein N0V89_004618 [Didymosphaeria variabile]